MTKAQELLDEIMRDGSLRARGSTATGGSFRR